MTITVNKAQLAALARELQARIPGLKYLHALSIIAKPFGYENESALLAIVKRPAENDVEVASLTEHEQVPSPRHLSAPHTLRKTTDFHPGFNRVMEAALRLPVDTPGRRALLSTIAQERAAASDL